MIIKHHHRVALYLGWLAGGLATLGAYLFDASDSWLITAAVALTSFTVALAAVLWPFV
jgi:hypothetical protein